MRGCMALFCTHETQENTQRGDSKGGNIVHIEQDFSDENLKDGENRVSLKPSNFSRGVRVPVFWVPGFWGPVGSCRVLG